MRKELIYALGATALAIFSLGYAIGRRKKLNDLTDRIDKAVDNLSEDIEIDVQRSVVDRAIVKAIDREIDATIPKVVKSAVKGVQDNIEKQVANEIESHYKEIRNDVEQEVHKQVSKLDVEKLKREVIAAAKKDAAEKLDGSLDDILEDFNRNLKNLSAVYQSMATTMSGAGKELKVSLG